MKKVPRVSVVPEGLHERWERAQDDFPGKWGLRLALVVVLDRGWNSGRRRGAREDCGLSLRKMEKMWIRIAPCFITHPKKPGWLTNKRLDQERESQDEYREAMQKAEKKGADKRWGGHKPSHSQANSQAIYRPMAKNSSAVRSLL